MVTEAGIRRVWKRLAIGREVEADKQCMVCGERAIIPIVSAEDINGLINWKYRKVPIQEALPHWSADQRELLLTGTHKACWELAFPPEDDERA